MNFIKLFRLNFKNSLYFRMLFLYSSILIVTSIIFISAFTFHQHESFSAKSKADQENNLSQFSMYTDYYFLEQLTSIFSGDIFVNNYEFKEIFYDTDSYEYDTNNFNPILRIRNFLKLLHVDIDFIESIDLYNITHDTFVSSTDGIIYNYTDTIDTYKNSSSPINIDAIATQDSEQFWVGSASLDGSPYAAFVQATPLFAHLSNCDTLLIFHINFSHIYDSFFEDANLDRRNVKIMTPDGHIVFDTASSDVFAPLSATQLHDIVGSSPNGTYTLDTPEESFTIHWKTSSVNNVKYIYSTALGRFNSAFFSSLELTLLWFGILLVIGITAVFIISKKLYSPLGHIVSLSQSTLATADASPDLQTLSLAFSNMDAQVSKFKHLVEKNDTLILSNINSDLLNNKFLDIDSLNNRLSILDKQFVHNAFYMLVFQFNEKQYNVLNDAEKELLHLNISSLIEEFFYIHFPDNLKTSVLFDYDGHLTCMVNANPSDYAEEMLLVQNLFAQLNTQFNNLFNLAVSEPSTTLNQFRQTYQTLLGYFKYAYIYGSNNIFTPASIANFEASDAQLTSETLQHLELLLKSHKFDLLKERLTLLLQHIKENGYSYLYTYNLFLEFVALIAQEADRQNITSPVLLHQHLLKEFSSTPHIEVSINWLHTIIDTLDAEINLRNDSIDNGVITHIIDYINANADNQLSLTSVAAEFNISTGHLSRLFKEKVGTNFSEFASNVKFEKAVKLLLENPSMKISTLSEELGYSNVTYFTKLFKERYGMTPTQYRKLHKNG